MDHPFGSNEDVRRLLGASEPELAHLLDERFSAGSQEPQQQFHQTASGLLVPTSPTAVPDASEFIRVYLTSEELLGFGWPLERIRTEIAKLPRQSAVNWCAFWLSKLQAPHVKQTDVDQEFMDTYFKGELLTRAKDLLATPRRVLLTAQALVVAMKFALEQPGPLSESDHADFDHRLLVASVLALASHLTGAEAEGADDEQQVIGERSGAIGRYMVANQMFNNPGDWQTAWAVSERCLRELPRELSEHERVVDFEQAYFDATGVAFDDLVTVCATAWASAINTGPAIPLNYFLPLGWEPERLKAVLDLVAVDVETLSAELLREHDGEGLLWSTLTFDRYPLINWGQSLTVLHPGWLVRRSTDFWPLLDVRRILEGRGDTQLSKRIEGSVRHTYEHHVLEVFEDLAGADRTYRDDRLRAAYGRRSKVADAAIDYGTDWVIVEVTTKGFQLRTAAGISDESLEQDLDDIVDKARQIEATINNIRRDELRLTGGGTPAAFRKFHPVIVTAARFAGNPITFTMLRERLRANNVLQADDCTALQVLDLEDLHAVEGAVESGGTSLLELLAAKSEIEHPLVPMRDFLYHRLGRVPPYPRRILQRRGSWMDIAVDQVHRNHRSPSAHPGD